MRSHSRGLLLAILSILAAFAYGSDLLGTALRVVHVLTLVTVSMTAGVSLVQAAASRREAGRLEGPPPV